MDVYLPADFCLLRDESPDWRDLPATDTGREKAPAASTRIPADPINACADPLWNVF